MSRNPCLTCGACCAAFSVQFPEAQADDQPGGWVPCGLTLNMAEGRRAMKGTLGFTPRCQALEGRIGVKVHCRIYPNRPSICKAFCASGDHGRENHLCNRSRALFGLQPISTWSIT